MTPSAEDLLRARLREVDDLQPPTTDFEMRALRTGRERLKRRQGWTRGIIAAAAAVAVGVLAVPTVARLQVGGTAGSSTAASKAAPQGGEAGAQTDRGAAGGSGSTPADPLGRGVETTLVSLRSSLARDYPESFTALTLDSSPLRVVLHMTTDAPAAQRAVRDVMPPGVEVVTEQSAFSAAQCQATLARVSADRRTLTGQGYALGSASCDADGRVALQVTNLVTAEQIQALVVRYADGVAVVQVAGAPSS